jgi:mercuric ion binding protein
MRKKRLLILSFLTISFFIFSNNSFAAEQTITFKVDGMYCSACPAIVKKVLKSIEGVKKTTVSYSNKTAVVTFEDTKTDTKSLIQATTKAGYKASVIN